MNLPILTTLDQGDPQANPQSYPQSYPQGNRARRLLLLAMAPALIAGLVVLL